MNIDEIMTLVKAVSDYNLTSFELEEGNVKISLKREKEMPQIVTVGAPAMDAASAAVSAQMMGAAMAAQAAPGAAAPKRPLLRTGLPSLPQMRESAPTRW